MINIVLGILKLISLIIIYLLLFLIVVIVLILVLPISYKIKTLYSKQLRLSIRANYFFHIFRFKLDYDDDLSYIFKIFNFTIISSGQDEEIKEYEEVKKSDNTKDTMPLSSPKNIEESQDIEITKIESQKEAKESIINKKAKKTKNKKRRFDIIEYIKKIIRSIKNKILSFIKILKNIDKRKKRILRSIKDEKNRQAIKKIYILFLNLLRHLMPRKIKAKLVFGFEDPATTANILAYLSLIPAKIHKKVDIIPMFNTEIIDIDLFLSGRVHLIYILYILFCTYFDRNIKRLYNLYRKKKLF